MIHGCHPIPAIYHFRCADLQAGDARWCLCDDRIDIVRAKLRFAERVPIQMPS